MSDGVVELEVPATRRLVLVRFRRGRSGEPVLGGPDIDDRATSADPPGPVVGITAGQTVTIALDRVRLDNKAMLTVRSDAPDVARVTTPADEKTPLSEAVSAAIKIQGVAGGDVKPKTAKIQVRYHASPDATPVVIGELNAWVYTRKKLAIALHRVTLKPQVGSSSPVGVTLAKLDDLLKYINSIWAQCGVEFEIKSDTPAAHVTRWPGRFDTDPPDMNVLFKNHFVPGHLNTYAFAAFTRAGKLGMGIDKDWAKLKGYKHRGLVFAETQAADGAPKPIKLRELAHTLAHELGHYLGLSHPHDVTGADPPRVDQLRISELYARRSLMYNSFPIYSTYGFAKNIGNGEDAPGMLIPFKALAGDLPDMTNRCEVARKTIADGAYDT